MEFFDGVIRDTEACLEKTDKIFCSVQTDWPDNGRNELVLQRDCAFELDGVGFNLVTSKDIGGDAIVVAGDDLPSIGTNRSFTRISYIQMDDVEDEQKAYDLIRKIEYAKYHYFPKGYMIRTASDNHKEVVRVSKSAVNNGLKFRDVGALLIRKYKENAAVKAVKVVFVTDKNADYSAFEKLAKKNYDITETLNHIMRNINFDCSTCNLKPICDEVEGLKELHFKNSKM